MIPRHLGQLCVDAPATQDFSLYNFERRVKRFRVSGLLVRRIDGCRRPAEIGYALSADRIEPYEW